MGHALIALILLGSVAHADIITIPAPAPSGAPSLKDKQAAFKVQILQVMNGEYQRLASIVKTNATRFWDTSDGMTVQQHFDAFGPDQCALRVAFLRSAQYLNQLAPGTLTVTEPETVTMAGSGKNCKVTVGETE